MDIQRKKAFDHVSADRRMYKKVGQEVMEMLSDPETNRNLLSRADAILSECESRGIGTIIFLDKAARPLAWLLKERAAFLGKPLPERKFINVGTDQYRTSGSAVLRGVASTTFGDRLDFIADPDARKGIQLLKKGHIITTTDVGGAYAVRKQAENTMYNDALATFAHSIQGPVLILDDQVSSGASLFTAMKIIENTGIHTPIYGASFFVDEKQTTIHKQRKQIPWRGLNYSGIIEDVDPAIFTHRPTEERIANIRHRIQEAMQKEMQDMEEFVECIINEENMLCIESHIKMNRMNIEVMNAWKSALEVCVQIKQALDFSKKNFLGMSKEEIFMRIHRNIDKNILLATYQDPCPLPEKMVTFRFALPLVVEYSNSIERLHQAVETVEEPEVYIARGKVLREGIRQLAREDVLL